MALVKCPECGRDKVSSTALQCPECGFNLREYYEKLDAENIAAQENSVIPEECDDHIESENTEEDESNKMLYQNEKSNNIYITLITLTIIGIILIVFFAIISNGESNKALDTGRNNAIDYQDKEISNSESTTDDQNTVEDTYTKKELYYDGVIETGSDFVPTFCAKTIEMYKQYSGAPPVDASEDYYQEVDNLFMDESLSYIGCNAKVKIEEIKGQYTLVKVVDKDYKGDDLYNEEYYVLSSEVKSLEDCEACQYPGCEEIGVCTVKGSDSRIKYCSEHFKEKNEEYEISQGGKIKVDSQQVERSHGTAHVSGSVKNTTPDTVYFVKVKVETKKDGKIIDTSSTYAIGDEGLKSGASVTFDCYMDDVSGAIYVASVYDYQ